MPVIVINSKLGDADFPKLTKALAATSVLPLNYPKFAA